MEEDKKIESPPNNQTGQTPADFLDIPTIRTYKADVNQTIKGDKINVAKVLIAEQKKKEKEALKLDKNSIEKPANKVKLSFSVLFITIAIIAIIFAVFTFLLPKINNNQNINITDPGEVFVTDKQQKVDIDGKSEEEIKQIIKDFFAVNVTVDSINELIFYKKEILKEQEVLEKINSQSILNILDIEMPDVLGRSFSNNYVLGFYTKNEINYPFIIFKLADFENAYGSIFDFEKNIIFQMRKLFGGFDEFDVISSLQKQKIELLPNDPIVSSTSTSTSTPKIISTTATTTNSTTTEQLKNLEIEIAKIETKIKSYQDFKDIILQNTDSRAIFDENSTILFYYAFIDREWLIFAENIEALKEVKRRIREKKLIR